MTEVDIELRDDGRNVAHQHRYNIAVFIGRFQPFHLGHLDMIKAALAHAPNLILVLGSATTPRNLTNPFTWQERAEMIRAACATLPQPHNIYFLPMRDYFDWQRWCRVLNQAVNAIAASIVPHARLLLIGHQKDASSNYLYQLAAWPLIEISLKTPIDATYLRQNYWQTPADSGVALPDLFSQYCPPAVVDWLSHWRASTFFAALKNAALSANAQSAPSTSPTKFQSRNRLHCLLVVNRRICLEVGAISVNAATASSGQKSVAVSTCGQKSRTTETTTNATTASTGQNLATTATSGQKPSALLSLPQCCVETTSESDADEAFEQFERQLLQCFGLEQVAYMQRNVRPYCRQNRHGDSEKVANLLHIDYAESADYEAAQCPPQNTDETEQPRYVWLQVDELSAFETVCAEGTLIIIDQCLPLTFLASAL